MSRNADMLTHPTDLLHRSHAQDGDRQDSEAHRRGDDAEAGVAQGQAVE